MKKMTSLCAVLLFLLSAPVFAKEHLTEAMEHAKTAVAHGEDGDTAIFIKHANQALEYAVIAATEAKGLPKKHLEDAAKELQQSIELANWGHIGSATIHAQAALRYFEISNKYTDSAEDVQNP